MISTLEVNGLPPSVGQISVVGIIARCPFILKKCVSDRRLDTPLSR